MFICGSFSLKYNPAMKRWAFNPLRGINHAFCLFSLLVFLSSMTIWVRSYFVMDHFILLTSSGPTRLVYWQLNMSRGTVVMARTVATYDSPTPAPSSRWQHYTNRPAYLGGFIGFGYSEGTSRQGFNTGTRMKFASVFGRALAFPLWLFLPAGVPPFLWWRKWRKKGGRGFPVEVTAAATGRPGERQDQVHE